MQCVDLVYLHGRVEGTRRTAALTKYAINIFPPPLCEYMDLDEVAGLKPRGERKSATYIQQPYGDFAHGPETGNIRH